MNFLKKKDFDSVKDTSNSSGLEKSLTAWDLILFGIGAIVGTGVFVLTGLVAAQYSGPAVTVSYLIAGGTCIFVALAYTELASMLPTSGSVYTYTYVAFGEIFAWLIASMLILELGFTAATVSSGWSAYFQGIVESAGYVIPASLTKVPSEGGYINLPALLIVVFIGSVLYLGTKDSKKLNTILVFVKMAAIFAFVFSAAPHFDATNWQNFMPFGADDMLRGSSMLFFAFTGFGILASAAEECKNPKRDLTIGIIGSLVIATTLYMIIGGLLTGIVHYDSLNNAQALVTALKANNSNIGSAIVATGAIAGMTTVIMMNIYGQSRIFYVIARDGLLPKSLARLHHKYDSPYVTIMIFTLMVGILGAFCPVQVLGQLSSMGAIIDYVVIVVIVVVFRLTIPHAERPFKCPAIFLVAPIALVASICLLFKQIFDKDGNLLLSGKIIIWWLIAAFLAYVIAMLIKNRNKA
jgi:APA family basic amino acid/polyamine antiporter